MLIRLFITLVFLVFFQNYALADNNKSIDITSDSFKLELKDTLMTFSKNVFIKYHSIEAKCDKALVYIESKTGKVVKIVMTGNVKIQKENAQINGDKVTFETDEEKIIVDGNVKTKIKFNLNN